MRIVLGFSTLGHVAGVAFTSQSATDAGEPTVMNGVLEFIGAQRVVAEQQAKEKTEELEAHSADCAREISGFNKAILMVETSIADLQSSLTSTKDSKEAAGASLADTNAELTTQMNRLQEIQESHEATQTTLQKDSAATQKSVEGLEQLINGAAGSHASVLIGLAKKFRTQLQDRSQNIKNDMANEQSSVEIEVHRREDEIQRLHKSVEDLNSQQDALSTEVASIEANLKTQKKAAQESQQQAEKKSQECKKKSDDLHAFIQEQTNLQDLMGTIETLLGGNVPSFLQQSVVSSDIRTLKKSIQVLARKYQDKSLIRVASHLNGNEAQWGIIMTEIQKLIGQLSEEIHRRELTLQNFEHQFDSVMNKAHDVCQHLETSNAEMEAAKAAADKARQDVTSLTDNLASDRSDAEDALAQLQGELVNNNQEIKQLSAEAKGFNSALEVVEQRGLKAELVHDVTAKMEEAVQSVRRSITDLQEANDDLSKQKSSKSNALDIRSQGAKAEIAEKTAVAQNQAKIAEQLGSKIHLLNKEQVTLLGQLGNMDASNECTNSAAACDSRHKACGESFQDALDSSRAELKKLQDEFDGVKEAASTLRNFIKDQN